MQTHVSTLWPICRNWSAPRELSSPVDRLGLCFTGPPMLSLNCQFQAHAQTQSQTQFQSQRQLLKHPLAIWRLQIACSLEPTPALFFVVCWYWSWPEGGKVSNIPWVSAKRAAGLAVLCFGISTLHFKFSTRNFLFVLYCTIMYFNIR